MVLIVSGGCANNNLTGLVGRWELLIGSIVVYEENGGTLLVTQGHRPYNKTR